MTSATGGHIEDLAFRKTMELLGEKLGRWWLCAEDVLRESCALNVDSDGAGHIGDWGM